MKISILLPYKESLNQSKTGAVSIYVQDTFKYTKYKKNITIINSDNFSNSKIYRSKSEAMKEEYKLKKNYILRKKIKNKFIHNEKKYIYNSTI